MGHLLVLIHTLMRYQVVSSLTGGMVALVVVLPTTAIHTNVPTRVILSHSNVTNLNYFLDGYSTSVLMLNVQHQLQFISIKFLLRGLVLLLLVTKFSTTAKYELSFVFLVLLHHSLLKSMNHFIKMIKVTNLTLFHLIHGFTDLIVTVVLVLLVQLLILFMSNLLLTHVLVLITQNHVLITVFTTSKPKLVTMKTKLCLMLLQGNHLLQVMLLHTIRQKVRPILPILFPVEDIQ